MEIVSGLADISIKVFADDINKVKPNLVIDVGCGNFWSKGLVNNVVGFDQSKWGRIGTSPGRVLGGNVYEPDYICMIKEAPFEPECADVVMCIGSLNINDSNIINESDRRYTHKDTLSDFDFVYKWSKKYIVIRARWTTNFIKVVTKKYKLKILGDIVNYPKPQVPYNYYWWMKK